MKPLTDPVGLRTVGLAARLIDILQGLSTAHTHGAQIATILRAPIGQHSEQSNFMLFKERQHPIVK